MLNVMATKTERDAAPARGPRFFREGGAVLFEFVIDPTNKIGPRPAKKDDSLNHAEAWSHFVRGDEAAEPEAPEAPPAPSAEEKDMDAFAKRLERTADAEPPREAHVKIERASRRRKR